MKRLSLAIILFGLSNSFAAAEGDSGSLYVSKTMRQVQTGDYSYQIDQNGEEHFRGRRRAPGRAARAALPASMTLLSCRGQQDAQPCHSAGSCGRSDVRRSHQRRRTEPDCDREHLFGRVVRRSQYRERARRRDLGQIRVWLFSIPGGGARPRGAASTASRAPDACPRVSGGIRQARGPVTSLSMNHRFGPLRPARAAEPCRRLQSRALGLQFGPCSGAGINRASGR